ncbi:hypothetical protein Tco_1434928, partial [Tanacetum coccineum]
KKTCDELEREICADKDIVKRILKEKDKIKSDFFKIENEKIIIQHETQLAKKAFKERENRYLEDICDLKEKLSSHDRIVYKMGQSIQTIHMLDTEPNKVYDPFLKAGLGYKNPERLKKAIIAQPKMYGDEMLHNKKEKRYRSLGFLVIMVNNKGFIDSQGLTNPTDKPGQGKGFPLLTVSTRQIQEGFFCSILEEEATGDSLLKKQLD